MKRLLFALAALLLAIGFSGPAGTAVPGPGEETKEVNIHADEDRLKKIANSDDFEAIYTWYDIEWIGGHVDEVDYYKLKADPTVEVEDVRYHEIQQPGGPPGGGGCGDTSPCDQTPYGIEQIYDDPSLSSTSGGSGVTLGHLDTGVDADHPDLVNRIVYSDGDDGNGHGTHTAGTAAADAGDSGDGIYGVASDSDVRSYKVCNNGGLCKTTDIVNAINDCTNNGDRKCDVITYSIGSDSSSSSISDAIDAFTDAGGLFVAAAGNDGPDLKTIDFPAWKDNTAAVGAINADKTVTDFSSRGDDDGNCGSTKYDVDFAAAGDDVESTVPDDTYGNKSGTSMATPHVSGLALKKWDTDGSTTYSNLKSNVEDITSGQHAGTGCDAASGDGLPHVG